MGTWFIHYSTDYVFPGDSEEAWKKSDLISPLNVYGKTKLAGEKTIQAVCQKYLIFRTSWVYAGKGHNFARMMLRLAKERAELSVIDDQYGVPTGAELLADCAAHTICTAMIKPQVVGGII